MSVSKWDAEAIQYTDVDKLREILVGRSITSTLSEGGEYDRVLSFVLDNGSILKAHAADGGCACSNGCFSVDNPDRVTGTILNVEIEEIERSYSNDDKPVTPGSLSDGEAVIRLFVYDELGKHTLVQSEGGDNGYYGWGYHLSLQLPEVVR